VGRVGGRTTAEEVVAAYRALADDGLITGSAGNVSARTERGMLITPSAVPPSAIEPGDLCELDLATGLVSAGTPSSEWLLHLGIYRAGDAGAVVHTHSLAATAVSLIADELPAVHYYINRLGGPVPVVPYATYGSIELADAVGSGLRGRHAVIMANHGAVTTGADVGAAVERARLLEWIAELYLTAAAVATPRSLSAADLDAVRAQPVRIAERGYRLG
jgi:L-fuculose-phosphate aldolase